MTATMNAMSTGRIRNPNRPEQVAESQLPREILGDDFRWRDRHLPLGVQSISVEQLYQMFISRFVAEMVAAQEDIQAAQADERRGRKPSASLTKRTLSGPSRRRRFLPSGS
jgi:hypothetical protein